ncbi:CGNR zinc finger domain-containing protein [Pseudonocardia sp. TRM90224]|uniref:CGNR zinc finger domain-containing protein n=1 Tax=Pseudonocardia sp. TRM90224 TaxID=2812678 RepID=UPI001E3AD15A|nr:CGNR zinc finger domain-containing protein [Pseudonocardia sp. TRM90224]
MKHTVDPDGEVVLLDLLNTTPVTADGPTDLLADDAAATAWARARGGVGSAAEATHLRRVRDRLQAVVRGAEPASALGPALRGVRLVPDIDGTGLSWRLDTDDDRRLAARALLAWGRVQEQLPGRLRPCANDECHLFLLDRSRPNTARWCSMKVCGNRLKARRHYQRSQQGE